MVRKNNLCKTYCKKCHRNDRPDMTEQYQHMARIKPSNLLEGEVPHLIDVWQIWIDWSETWQRQTDWGGRCKPKTPNRQGVGKDVGLEVGLAEKIIAFILKDPEIKMAEMAEKLEVTTRTIEREMKKTAWVRARYTCRWKEIRTLGSKVRDFYMKIELKIPTMEDS